MKYKAIVFDYGGVLVTNGLNSRKNLINEISSILDISDDEFREEYFKHNHLSNIDGKPWVEAILSATRVFDASPEAETKVRNLNENFNNSKRLNTELIAKILELKGAGYKVAILSNYTAELRSVLEEQGILEHFDEVFVSSELGCQKPDPQAFAAVCNGLNIKSAEMVFIDDTTKSLETAKAVGYTPILFESNMQLFAALDELKVLPKG